MATDFAPNTRGRRYVQYGSEFTKRLVGPIFRYPTQRPLVLWGYVSLILPPARDFSLLVSSRGINSLILPGPRPFIFTPAPPPDGLHVPERTTGHDRTLSHSFPGTKLRGDSPFTSWAAAAWCLFLPASAAAATAAAALAANIERLSTDQNPVRSWNRMR